MANQIKARNPFSDAVVAHFDGDVWEFEDAELGKALVELFQTGIAYISGSVENDEEGIIGDTMTIARPGSAKFNELLADEIEAMGYVMEGVDYVGD